MGIWLGLLLLVRSQFIVPIAAFFLAGTISIVLIAQSRKGMIGMALLAMLSCGLTLLPQWLFLRSFIEGAGLNEMIRFERYQATTTLPRLELLVQTDGILSWIIDRAKGFLVAFPEGNKYSYYNQFGAYYWSLPVAMVFGIPVLWKRRMQAASLWAWLQKPESAWPVFLAIHALAWFASIHILHKANFTPWNFALRHATPCLFLFMAANQWLIRQGGFAQLCALFLLFAGVHYQFQACQKAPMYVRWTPEEVEDQKRIVHFLKEQHKQNPSLRVASPLAQRFASLTNGILYDGVYNNTTLNDLELMFSKLGADMFILKADDHTRLMKDPRFSTACLPWPEPVENWQIYTCFEDTHVSQPDPTRP
mgnify:CR=1 FL=1